ncbi:retinol dehydrogenase 11-like [Amphiura filiformis]|uniref:retinol dehydrogenase 11-like n=1 Tax=Amphiura filiformis TaxID=82378 RepID=UPI003B20E970
MGARLTYPEITLAEDRTYIVTGGNGGIGYETAKYIAAHGGRVIIACRSEERADGPDTLNVEFMKLDLESLTSTMEFINAYKAKGYPLHVLICNAGIAFISYTETADGFEKTFQVNYLSHLLLILHLIPLLRTSGPNSRIVMVSSLAHVFGSFNLDNIQGEQSYDRFTFYGHSKLYQIMSMYALDRRLKNTGIGIFAVHPGTVETGLATNNWTESKILVPITHNFLKLFLYVFQSPAIWETLL